MNRRSSTASASPAQTPAAELAVTREATLRWTRLDDGSWTAADGRFRTARLSSARWTLEDAHRGTGSILERTAGVYSTLRDARAAAQGILDEERAKAR
jgi:hypothetical protein